MLKVQTKKTKQMYSCKSSLISQLYNLCMVVIASIQNQSDNSKTCMRNGNQINLVASGAKEKIILFIINMLEMLFFLCWHWHCVIYIHMLNAHAHAHTHMYFCKQLSYDLFYMSHCDARQSVVAHTKIKIYLRRFSALPQPFSKKRVINMRR